MLEKYMYVMVIEMAFQDSCRSVHHRYMYSTVVSPVIARLSLSVILGPRESPSI